MIKELLLGDQKSSVEADGYYENIPLRVGEYVLSENVADKIVFETTNSEICESHGRQKLVIKNSKKGWCVNKYERGGGQSIISPAEEIDDEMLERARALWHAKQYMLNNNLNNKERYSKIYRTNSTDIFEDDAFFNDGKARTLVPFREYLDK